MRSTFVFCGAIAVMILNLTPVFAQTAPGQTVNVTPNQQTTQASAVSNPSGQNISQQNNFYDPGSNSFGPGISCAGPYLASSLYRNDSSNPGQAASGFANVGGTIGLVVPINGTNKKCQEFVNEILFQRQIDTCLSMAKQGFSFDPNGQYASLAKRCSGIKYTGAPIATANPLSPPPPPTVITVPASGSSSLNAAPLPGSAQVRTHAELDVPVAPAQAPVPVTVAALPATPLAAPAAVRLSPTCQPIAPARKHALIRRVKTNQDRRGALDTLRAACVPDAEIMAAL